MFDNDDQKERHMSDHVQVSHQQVQMFTLFPGGDFWSSLAILQTGLNVTLQQPAVNTAHSTTQSISKT